jgi:hypothetical protein
MSSSFSSIIRTSARSCAARHSSGRVRPAAKLARSSRATNSAIALPCNGETLHAARARRRGGGGGGWGSGGGGVGEKEEADVNRYICRSPGRLCLRLPRLTGLSLFGLKGEMEWSGDKSKFNGGFRDRNWDDGRSEIKMRFFFNLHLNKRRVEGRWDLLGLPAVVRETDSRWRNERWSGEGRKQRR